MANKQEVVEKKQHNLLLPEGMDLAELQGDAGAGITNMTSDDIGIPYLSILQSMSPQAQPGNPKYIEGAQASMFFDTVSNNYFDGRTTGILFVPCAYDRKYVEWVDRDNGGGYVAEYDINSDILEHTKKDDKGKSRMPSGNIIVETAYHFGFYQEPVTGNWLPCVMPLKSTGLRVNRNWNHELANNKIPGTEMIAPRWLFIYRLTTWLETKKNNSWWQYRVASYEKDGNKVPVSKALYAKARDFNKQIELGEVKRSVEKEATAPVDDEIPF